MSRFGSSKTRTGGGASLGVILIGLGGLLALSNMGIIGGFGGVIGLIVLGGMGAWLLNQYYSGRRQLWLLLAGYVLLGAGAATVTGVHAGAWFLGIAGMGFLTAWREDDNRWWAVIPAGTLFTLSAVVVADLWWRWLDGGTVFFLGMAATFLALYVLPRHSQPWALIPAAVSGALALLIWGSSGTWVLPVILIATGLYLVRGTGQPGGGMANGGHVRGPSGTGGAQVTDPEPGATPQEPEPGARLLPERIDSTGPEIGEDWPGQGAAPRN